jgi:hypothetical protein
MIINRRDMAALGGVAAVGGIHGRPEMSDDNQVDAITSKARRLMLGYRSRETRDIVRTATRDLNRLTSWERHRLSVGTRKKIVNAKAAMGALCVRGLVDVGRYDLALGTLTVAQDAARSSGQRTVTTYLAGVRAHAEWTRHRPEVAIAIADQYTNGFTAPLGAASAGLLAAAARAYADLGREQDARKILRAMWTAVDKSTAWDKPYGLQPVMAAVVTADVYSLIFAGPQSTEAVTNEWTDWSRANPRSATVHLLQSALAVAHAASDPGQGGELMISAIESGKIVGNGHIGTGTRRRIDNYLSRAPSTHPTTHTIAEIRAELPELPDGAGGFGVSPAARNAGGAGSSGERGQKEACQAQPGMG